MSGFMLVHPVKGLSTKSYATLDEAREQASLSVARDQQEVQIVQVIELVLPLVNPNVL
jgi:hypothetical protein